MSKTTTTVPSNAGRFVITAVAALAVAGLSYLSPGVASADGPRGAQPRQALVGAGAGAGGGTAYGHVRVGADGNGVSAGHSRVIMANTEGD